MALRRGTRSRTAVALAALALVVVAGCGRDDFENDPRPAVPLEATVEVSDSVVQVSPPKFGAGLVNFSIANTSSKEIVFTLDGPTTASSLPVEPKSNTVLKVEVEDGSYDAGVQGSDSIKPAKLTVAGERPSSQNDLLLP